jgi:UDP-2,3-diacylglucosamine hydrolase
MKFAAISDIHIKLPNDDQTQILLKFLTSQEVKESESVYLLGDIFDFCVGNYKQYLEKHHLAFNLLKTETVDKGKRLYFIEGNHDFHLKSIFTDFFKSDFFIYTDEWFIQIIHQKKIMFTHGHELDRDNHAYNRWRRIYKSSWMKIFIEKVLPYFAVDYLAQKASKNSKERGRKAFNYNKLKNKYLKNAQEIINDESLDYLIAGHTHIPENMKFNKGQYINNGYPLLTNQFVFYNGSELRLISL